MWRMVLAYAGDPSDDTEQPLLEWSIPGYAGETLQWYRVQA